MTAFLATAIVVASAVPMALSVSSSKGVEYRPISSDEAAAYEIIANRYNGEMKPDESWTSGSSTNGISIFVCTDVQIDDNGGPMFIFRDFSFSSDGRLQSISPVCHATSVTTRYRTKISSKASNASHKKSINEDADK